MNKRVLPRLRRRLKIHLEGKPDAFTSDVSPQGFAAELMRIVTPGSSVTGSIALGGEQFPFTGKVCWAKQGEPRMNVRGRFGVCFTGIANRFYELLKTTWGQEVAALPHSATLRG